MKIIKNFKNFSILESGKTEMAYRTFFLVPLGTNENYCYMDFELTPISTSMPEMSDSVPGQCWIDQFDDDCDHYEKDTAEWEDCKDAEKNTGEWNTEHSTVYGKIFIVTFLLPLDVKIEIWERSVDDKETIEDVIAELKNNKKEIVSLYHLKNLNKDGGGYDYEDEYDFDLIGSMVSCASINFEDVALSIVGCSKYIQKDFISELAKTDFKPQCTPKTMSTIRKQAPELFDLMISKFGDGVITLSDLGEFGF